MLVASVDSIRSVTLQLNCSGTRVKYFPVICKGENDSILVEALYIFFFFLVEDILKFPITVNVKSIACEKTPWELYYILLRKKEKYILSDIIHMNVYAVLSCFSLVWLFVTPWTIAHQAPLSMEFPGK